MWEAMTIITAPFKVAYWSTTMLCSAVVCSVKSIGFVFTGSYNFVRWVRKWRDKDKPTHGNAHFEDDKSLKAKGYFTNHGFLACVTKKGNRVFTKPERTVVILAPPGSGKSQHLIADLRAKMKRPDDKLPHLVLGDAANELYENCAPLLRARGYDIAKISMVRPDEWTKYDLLSGLTPPETGSTLEDSFGFGRRVDALCRLLVPDEPNSKQPHFYEFARLMIKCGIVINVKYEGNKKTIYEIVAELIDDDKRDELLKRATRYGDPLVTTTMKTLAKMQGKPEGTSIMSTSLRKFEWCLDEAVKEVTTYGHDMDGKLSRGWRFEQMLSQKKPVALFLHTGTDETASGPLARMIYGNAINAVSNLLDKGHKMPRELEVIIDEASIIGYCNAVSHAYNRLRKAGVRIRMCFLGLSDFTKTYPDADKILAGSDIILFGGSNERELNRMGSELVGDYTVQSRNESQSTNGESKGRSEQARPRIRA